MKRAPGTSTRRSFLPPLPRENQPSSSRRHSKHPPRRSPGRNLKVETVELREGEALIGLAGTYSDRVLSIRVITNRGISDPVGVLTQHPPDTYSLRLPWRGRFSGFSGRRSGDALYALGLVYKQPDLLVDEAVYLRWSPDHPLTPPPRSTWGVT